MSKGEPLLTTDLPGAQSRRSGKVRDIYDYGDTLLIVATDRISAFDVVMPTGIPGKGRILSGLSRHWFGLTEHLVPNHLLTMDPAEFPPGAREQAEMLAGRAMLVRKGEVIPVECVVRGYLAGSGWRDYQETGTVGGHKLPEGLRLSDRLPQPIFSPATKEASGHDINITVEQAAEMVGAELAQKLEQLSLELYRFAAEHAAERGFILCDTKFEFGRVNGEIILIDEVFTPDSSRYWDARECQPGVQQEAFDKQYLRDWLEELVAAGKWNKEYPGPELPDEVVAGVLKRYVEAYERITGEAAPA
ncbi:MAG: phosphoribosylaminoimidazolesuccinocarboxamide synthase [Armatimonadota bacterium]